MGADDARKLFIGGVGDSVDETELRAFFEVADFTVEHVAIPRDRETGKVRGFGFVTLGTADEVAAALQRLNGAPCGGRSLSIRPFSQEAPKRGTERPTRGPEPSLFLGKLPYDATETEIIALFEANEVGPVVRVTLPLGPDGRPRGFGFVTLGSDEAATDAIQKINGATIRGRGIVVSKAEPKGRSAGGPPSPRGDLPPRPRQQEGFRGDSGFRSQEQFSPPSFGPPSFGGGSGFPPEGGSSEDGRGGGRRRSDGRKPEKKSEKRKGASREGTKGPRGGGGNWHRWEDDD